MKMDDILMLVESTDWEDPDDADWAFERLDYNPIVEDSISQNLERIATDPFQNSEKREFALKALARTSISHEKLVQVCRSVMKDSSLTLRVSSAMVALGKRRGMRPGGRVE